MSFSRTPVLSSKDEEDLKYELQYYWDRGYSAEQIAERLSFGIGQWKDLKRHHVYYYRGKFDLKPRVKRKSGGKRYKVAPEDMPEISIESTFNLMEAIYPRNFGIKSIAKRNRLNRAYLWMHLYSPLRKSEIYERALEDFDYVQNRNKTIEFIKVDLFRKKKKDPKLSPFLIPTNWLHVNEIMEWLEERTVDVRGDLDQKAFPLSAWKSLNTVKKLFPSAYPHFFRFKFITDRSANPDVSILDLHTQTDLHVITLEKYLLAGGRQRMDTAEQWAKSGQPK